MEPLLSDKQLSNIPGSPSVQTFRKWRRDGEGPPYIKIGHLVRYRLSDYESWLAENTVSAKS